MINPPAKVKSFRFNARKIEVPTVKPRAELRDAVQVYGTERAAVRQIRKQLAAQSADMDDVTVTACETALRVLETGHRAIRNCWTGDNWNYEVAGESAEILAKPMSKVIRFYKGTPYVVLSIEEIEVLLGRGFIITKIDGGR